MGKLLALLILLLPLLMVVAVAVAQESNIITHIKGFDGPLPFSLETGYVEVEETQGVQLFYYFVQSERNPAKDPLILWISGGPGCSGLNAFLFEIGPLKVDATASYSEGSGFPRLVYFEDSWTKVSSVIFLDAPVGTGFSYAREAHQGLNISLTGTSRHVRTFLQEWLAEHPEFVSNPLYLAGDSYSGYTIPVTALEIANANANGGGDGGGGGGGELKLNLVGYMVGNPTTADKYDHGARVPFMHGMGLISDELYEAARGTCRGDYVSPKPRNSRCAKALQAISLATSDVNSMHILEPTCPETRLPASTSLVATRSRLLLVKEKEEEEEELQVECRANEYLLSYIWADDTEVREMLGIRKGSVGSWSLCTIPPQFQYDVPSPIPYHRNLTRRGYRALVYNGDHDVSIPFLGTQAWIRTLGYPVVAPWRPWYDSKRQLAGFTTEYAYNLTFATVKGGGHMAPEARPKECLHMLRAWTSPAGRL